MGIKDLYYLIDKYGVSGGIIVFILVSLWILFKVGLFEKIINRISESYLDFFMKKRNKKIVDVSSSDIENHDIFSYIDFWMYSRIPTFQFSSDYRTIVFRKYLIIYLKSYKENLQNFLNSKLYVGMDDSQLWKSFLSLTNKIVYDYERAMSEAGIPQIIIDRMKSKNNDTISLTIDLIEGICNSQFYKSESNQLKVYSILNIMLSILDNTIHHSEQVCNSINGALIGMKFYQNGVTYTEPGEK